jgi:hypothetical protein
VCKLNVINTYISKSNKLYVQATNLKNNVFSNKTSYHLFLYTVPATHVLITEGLLTFSHPDHEDNGRRHVTGSQTSILEIIKFCTPMSRELKYPVWKKLVVLLETLPLQFYVSGLNVKTYYIVLTRSDNRTSRIM